jgi:tetraacyldisaccharide 4'-kinase
VTWLQSLLWPLTLPYGVYVRLRAVAYGAGILRQYRLNAKVISVGNLTTGGTGKTPMTLWIAERLLAEGKKVGILTRGYRGRSVQQPGGGVAAEDAQASTSRGSTGSVSTSDEVQLIAARLGDRVAFGVGGNRYANGSKLVKDGVEWFILDDGFQHMQLARDVNILIIDASNPFGGGHLLPAGRLREPKSALARADLIVITRSSHAPAVEAIIRHETGAPIYYACTHLESIEAVSGASGATGDLDARAKKIFVFCGIGNPAAFLADLREWGFEVLGHRFFADHHRYTQGEAEAIRKAALDSGAQALMCTEKDAFNTAGIDWQGFAVKYCRISMRVDAGDDFWGAIKALAEARGLRALS